MQEGTSMYQNLDKMEKIIKEFLVVRVNMTDCDQWPWSLLKSLLEIMETWRLDVDKSY